MKRASDRAGRARGRVRLAGRSRCRSLRLAWIHGLVVALALLVHVGRAAEVLLVEHAICEHGELIHLHRGLAGHAQAEGGKPARETEAHQGSAVDPAHGSHDHCAAGTLHHRVGDVGPSLAEPSLIPLYDAPQGDERRASSPIPLLHLAPKSSPPSASTHGRS